MKECVVVHPWIFLTPQPFHSHAGSFLPLKSSLQISHPKFSEQRLRKYPIKRHSSRCDWAYSQWGLRMNFGNKNTDSTGFINVMPIARVMKNKEKIV